MPICQPLVEELSDAPEPATAFRRLVHQPHCLFLDSARRDAELGRYSFLTADPFATIGLPQSDPGQLPPTAESALADDQAPSGTRSPGELLHGETLAGKTLASGPWATLHQQLAAYPADTVPGLPPFQGGAAGLFAYDLNQTLERIPRPRHDEFQVPILGLGLYDVVLAYDHFQNRAWLISQGFPERAAIRRQRRAAARLAQFRGWIGTVASDASLPMAAPQREVPGFVPPNRLAPQFPTGGPPGLTSNFSREGFLAAVQRARDYIYAGDLFQVNLAQRLLYPADDSAAALYLRLRERNPAPFAGYFDLGEFQIVSASPERFVRTIGRSVETRPIKGTRPRTSRPEADLYAADDLRSSEKDRAENVMIVDLLRNDLSRVCRPDSVVVTQLCRLEVYQFVQHLVSVVRGELADGRSILDLLCATFPGGSVTGAPKVRAMEIIAELEPTARGPYCGSLGYLGFDGSLDSSILIRTITAGRGWWQLPVGGGIVAQSIPSREYDETWDKATGLIRALRP